MQEEVCKLLHAFTDKVARAAVQLYFLLRKEKSHTCNKIGSIVNVWPACITPGSLFVQCKIGGCVWKSMPTPCPVKPLAMEKPFSFAINSVTCKTRKLVCMGQLNMWGCVRKALLWNQPGRWVLIADVASSPCCRIYCLIKHTISSEALALCSHRISCKYLYHDLHQIQLASDGYGKYEVQDMYNEHCGHKKKFKQVAKTAFSMWAYLRFTFVKTPWWVDPTMVWHKVDATQNFTVTLHIMKLCCR